METQFILEDSPARLEDFTAILMGSEEILNSMFTQFERIDFMNGLNDNEIQGQTSSIVLSTQSIQRSNSKKIPQSFYYISVVEEIKKVSRKNNWDMVVSNQKYYVYNGAYWIEIAENRFKSFLYEVSERLGVPITTARDYKFRESLVKQFLNEEFILNVEFTNSEVGINLSNGLLKIEYDDIQLLPFDKRLFLTYQLPYKYNPYANCPKFMDFLDTVLPDKELQLILAEYIGYIFLPNTFPEFKAEKVLILFGTGSNGKSVFNSIIKALIGHNNITEFSLNLLTDATNGAYRAKIENKLLNYSTEIGTRSDADIFKKLASGEPIDARPLYSDPYTIYRYAKFIFNANELPRDVNHGHAYFRRFLIIPFEVTITEDMQDKGLGNKIIKEELPGILNWALGGLQRLLINQQFTYSQKVEKVIQNFQTESDTVKLFLNENKFEKSNDKTISAKKLYELYKEFCSQDGYHKVSSVVFNNRMRNAGITDRRMAHGLEFFLVQKLVLPNNMKVDVNPFDSFFEN